MGVAVDSGEYGFIFKDGFQTAVQVFQGLIGKSYLIVAAVEARQQAACRIARVEFSFGKSFHAGQFNEGFVEFGRKVQHQCIAPRGNGTGVGELGFDSGNFTQAHFGGQAAVGIFQNKDAFAAIADGQRQKQFGDGGSG